MPDQHESRRWKRLLPGLVIEAGVQWLIIPALAAGMLLLANVIWSQR